MRTLWKILAWVSLLCGLLTFLTAWISLMLGKNIFGIAPEFYFFDAIGAVLFAIFFLIWGKTEEGKK
ncbi:MAG TPA: hypothetical protein HA360_00260 [Nanoarchaeota archaeon]|nr:hypothetical protein [Candidatus Woesearchaeota archaeon]HIH15311.1 hypothetical protein [Nanoarchaeota archaeon]HIH59201.1 hypothetical protein [Nanoarchaeota archaeon]HII13484.1 hypothetical protein [Nanoarchaeota archaeon]HIJ05573.1 hypothetical protein [Nanoarchaeota archaeon]